MPAKAQTNKLFSINIDYIACTHRAPLSILYYSLAITRRIISKVECLFGCFFSGLFHLDGRAFFVSMEVILYEIDCINPEKYPPKHFVGSKENSNF